MIHEEARAVLHCKLRYVRMSQYAPAIEGTWRDSDPTSLARSYLDKYEAMPKDGIAQCRSGDVRSAWSIQAPYFALTIGPQLSRGFC